MILIGNKSDLKNDRVITYEAGEETAKRYGVEFFETSAYSGENINEVFHKMGSMILNEFN